MSMILPCASLPQIRTARFRRLKSNMRRRSRLLLTCAVTLCLFSSLRSVDAAALGEPPGDQVLYGGWIDTGPEYRSSPTIFNERLHQNTPVFQVAQLIPLPKYDWVTGSGGPPPTHLIDETMTDAAIFVTVYPSEGFAAVQPADFEALGAQLLRYQVHDNRTVFLRYAPEFQGLWNKYGFQPTEFVAHWKTMYSYIKSIAPDTILVWAPNTGQNWPWGQSTAHTTPEDFAAMDTNHDGRLDINDDAYSPWYPGDGYVDWIGLSIYYKGHDPTMTKNIVQEPGYCHQIIMGVNPMYNNRIEPWYDNYCRNKPDKACMFAEAGAAFHPNDTESTITRSDMQQGWIKDCVTNETFLDTFPRLKMIMQFEFEKTETDSGNPDLRDYRVTNDTDVAAVLSADFVSIGTRFSWANSRAPQATYSAADIDAWGNKVTGVITMTHRDRSHDFPKLFGNISAAPCQKREFIELGVMVVAFITGALTVMRYL